MDTSKEYINMCEKAVEIQNKWYPYPSGNREGDYFKITTYTLNIASGIYIMNDRFGCWATMVGGSSHNCVEDIFKSFKERAIWLPRQDQLQEMVGNFETCMEFIDRWECVSSVLFDYQNVTSMDQLWLAFVMKERYSKCWDGKEWLTNE